VADVLGLSKDVFVQPLDGISLKPLFAKELVKRKQPIGFRYGSKLAWVDNRYKLLTENLEKGQFQLFDLEADPKESADLAAKQPERFERMKKGLLAWNGSVAASFAGKDYPERKVTPADPEPQFWYDLPAYQPYLAQWKERWEFKSYIERAQGKDTKRGKKKR